MSFSNLFNAVMFVSCFCIDYVVNTVNYNYPGDKTPFWVIERWNTKPSLCKTTGCRETAHRLLNQMDLSANPCEDFYRFSCGKFMDTVEIPPDEVSVSSFTEVRQRLNDQLRTLLEEPPGADEVHPHRSMRRIYALCMDEDAMDRRGVTPALRVLEEAGGWPVLGRWVEDFDFSDIEIHLRRLGIGTDGLITLGVSVDLIDTSRRLIVVGGPTLPLEKMYLENGAEDPIVQAYYSYMVDIAVLMGAEREVAEEDMWECVLLQIEIVKALKSDGMYYKLKLETLQNKISSVDWFKLIKYSLPRGVTVTVDELIGVNMVQYLENLENIIRYTPKRVIANYLLWCSVHSMATRLTREMRERSQQFSQILSGRTGTTPRWQTCIEAASSFTHAISSLYVKRYFKETAKQSAEQLVTKIRREMVRNIRKLDWMDDQTRSKAMAKAMKIREVIGYRTEILNNSKLEDFYKGMVLGNEQYFEAFLNISLWMHEDSWNKLRALVDKSDWREAGKMTEVNAFYHLMANSITFPAAILQPPFFRPDVPRYVNFATIGTVVGHEITHGFDVQGSRFDENGKIFNWWDDESKDNFTEKTQCMIDQYSQYHDTQAEMNVVGESTIGENVADNGGMKLSYNAWKRDGVFYAEEVLPGLEYFHSHQLFMVLNANLWCTKYRKEILKLAIKTGSHTLSHFRVKGMIQNHPEFGRAFKCSAGSPMDPNEKCMVW